MVAALAPKGLRCSPGLGQKTHHHHRQHVSRAVQRAATAAVGGAGRATSNVPGSIVNILTGQTAEVAPWLASHADVNGIDLAGAAGAATTWSGVISNEPPPMTSSACCGRPGPASRRSNPTGRRPRTPRGCGPGWRPRPSGTPKATAPRGRLGLPRRCRRRTAGGRVDLGRLLLLLGLLRLAALLVLRHAILLQSVWAATEAVAHMSTPRPGTASKLFRSRGPGAPSFTAPFAAAGSGQVPGHAADSVPAPARARTPRRAGRRPGSRPRSRRLDRAPATRCRPAVRSSPRRRRPARSARCSGPAATPEQSC